MSEFETYEMRMLKIACAHLLESGFSETDIEKIIPFIMEMIKALTLKSRDNCMGIEVDENTIYPFWTDRGIRLIADLFADARGIKAEKNEAA